MSGIEAKEGYGLTEQFEQHAYDLYATEEIGSELVGDSRRQ